MSVARPAAFRLAGIVLCVGCLGGTRRGSVVPGYRTRVDVARTFDHRSAFDGFRLLAIGSDGVPTIWNLRPGSEPTRLQGHTEQVNAVALSPDGARALTGSGRGGDAYWTSTDNSARLWDTKTGQEVRRYGGQHAAFVAEVAFSHDGSRILTLGDGTARVWDAASGRLLAVFPDRAKATAPADSPFGSQYLSSALLSRDGRTLLGVGGWWVRLWNVETGRELHIIRPDSTLWGAEFSPDERLLVLAVGRTAQIWNAQTGARVRVLSQPGYVMQASFSEDGRMIVTAAGDQTARLWDVGTGREVRRFAHPGKVNQVLLNRDGSRLLTRWADPLPNEVSNRVSLWDARTGTELRRFTEHFSGSPVAGFSPDGTVFPFFDEGAGTVQWCSSATGECK